MADNYLRASNGAGEAVMAVVTTERTVGSATLITDSVLNWPHRGIATSGTLDPVSGLIDPDTATVFKYHLDGSIIEIDEFAPGYPDEGNTEDQVVVVKPNTLWADIIAESIGEGGASVHIGDTPPPDPGEGSLWGDTSDDSLSSLVTAVGSLLMPIGHIFMTNSPDDPATYLGFGTWERIEGKFIVGVDDADSDFDFDDTGGAKTHSHPLSAAGQAAIYATANILYQIGSGVGFTSTARGTGLTTASNVTAVGNSAALMGNTDSGSSLPPFIAKYIWERTA